MFNLSGRIQNQLNQTSQYISGIGTSIEEGVTHQVHRVQNGVTKTCQSAQRIAQKTVDKTNEFILRHKEEIFFIGCCGLTAYFMPQLFFPFAVATAIFRVELSRQLQSYANHYLKDEHNPYKVHPNYGPSYVSSLDLTMATIAMIDAVALGTFFFAGSLSVAMLPALGGIAAGSCAAKLGMDFARS